ncbi:MAG: TonB-dependent receptor [Sphingobacteriia bacterium]|nr:MAG: TonB-dependent receptor [Sphingobacteriia bacterium]
MKKIMLAIYFMGSVIYLHAQEKDSVKILEEVVVTGQYSPQSLRKSVYNVRTINRQQILMRGANDLVGVLNNQLGIRFSNDYTLGESDISIMGMNGQNVKILLDGIPLIDRGSTKQSLIQIDINNIERIEIVEGPMSVIYGTDALAGVINIITKKNTAVNNTLSIHARIQEESMGKQYSPFTNAGIHNENIGINWKQNKWNADASITRNIYGGFSENPIASRVEVSKPKAQYLFSGTTGFKTEKINTWYRLDALQEQIFAAGALNPNNYRAKDQYYITNRFTHQLQSDWIIHKKLHLNASASFQDYARKTETFIKDFTNGLKIPSSGAGEWDITTFKTIFFRNTMQWFITEKFKLQPGIEIKSDRTSGQRVYGSPIMNDYSLFASAEIKPIKSIQIRPGIRVSKNNIYSNPPAVYSLNTKFSVHENLDIRISYARGYRAPILRELYFYFFDANHSIMGNPNLKAELSDSYIGAVNWQIKNTAQQKISSSLSLFYNKFNNRIALAMGTENIYTYINIDQYKTTGATLENSFINKNLTASLGLSYIGRYNYYSDEANYKALELPAFVWSPEINSNIIYRIPVIKAQAGIFYKYTGAMPAYQTSLNLITGQTEVNLTKMSGYHWADINLSKTIPKYFTIQAGVKNIFDVMRVNNTTSTGRAHSTGGPVLTGFGRSFFVGLQFQWSRS